MNYEQHSSAIQGVIADYFRGIHEGDIETLRRVFHPRAQLFGDIKGEQYHRTLPDYLEAVRARKSPAALGEPFRMRILSIECVNGIASARLHCPMLGFNYHDVLALNFIEGRWQVVSKLFTHADRARWPTSVGWTERRDGRVSARPKTSMPESTEAQLLARVARGDTDAFGALYDLHAGVLFSLALRILRNHATAEEVLQDVFCQIWEKAGAYDPKRGKPLTWAMTLTRNKAVDRLRSANRRAQLFDPGTEAEVAAENFLPEATNSVLSNETASMVRAALASLPQDQRQAIEMAFFGGLTQTEIAAALNQPLGTVKARIRRGMMQLRESLEVLR